MVAAVLLICTDTVEAFSTVPSSGGYARRSTTGTTAFAPPPRTSGKSSGSFVVSTRDNHHQWRLDTYQGFQQPQPYNVTSLDDASDDDEEEEQDSFPLLLNLERMKKEKMIGESYENK